MTEPKATEPSDGELLATGRAIADELAGPLTRMHRTIPYGAARDAAGIAYCHAFRAGRASHRCCFDPPVGAPIDLVAPSDKTLQAISCRLSPVRRRRAIYNAGRASRDAEVEALKAAAEHQASLNDILRSEYDRMCSGMAREQSRLRAEIARLRAGHLGYHPPNEELERIEREARDVWRAGNGDEDAMANGGRRALYNAGRSAPQCELADAHDEIESLRTESMRGAVEALRKVASDVNESDAANMAAEWAADWLEKQTAPQGPTPEDAGS